MEKRFRREKNLSHRVQKKQHEPMHQIKKITEVDSGGGTEESPLEHLSHTYASIQTSTVLRDTLLLGSVLVIFLLSAAWALPRVFSFHIDIASLTRSFLPETL